MTLPIHTLIDRSHFGQWLKQHGVNGIGVEVGTFYGEYAKQLAETWGTGMLFTVDPYDWNRDAAYVDGCRKNWAEGGKADIDPLLVMEAAQKRLNPLQNVKMIRARSLDAARSAQDGTLAFVYLDGNHSGEAVAAEIRAWWPKIRRGGILAGHDFYFRNDEHQKCDVLNAVLDWADHIRRRPHVTQCTSWWMLKP